MVKEVQPGIHILAVFSSIYCRYMTHHVGKDQIERFLRGELSPDQILSLDEHLAACSECIAAVAALPTSARAEISFQSALFPGPEVDGHLSYDELEGYADQRLDAVQLARVERHFAECNECALEAKDLSRFAEPDMVGEPAADSGREQRPTFWRLFSRGGFQLAAACLVVVGLAAFGWYAWNRSEAGSQERASSEPFQPVLRSADISNPSQPPANYQESDSNSPANTADALRELRFSITDGGKAVGIDKSGKLAGYPDLTAAQADEIAKALETGAVPISPVVAELRSSAGTLMGGDSPSESFALVGPAGKVIAADTPVFAWRPLAGAESYRVAVYDADLNKVAESGPLTKTSWSIRLPRGRTYTWQVTAAKGGKEFISPARPAPEARFRIVGAREISEIESARRRSPRSHLLLGVLYAEAGLLDEAAAEFQALRVQNPSSDQVRRLVQQVQKARSRTP